MATDTGGPASEKTLLDEFADDAFRELVRDELRTGRQHNGDTADVLTRLVHGRAVLAECAYDVAEAMITEKRRREADNE